MKKNLEYIAAFGFIFLILCLCSLKSSAQWLGSDPTISGNYSGNIGWNGTGTVTGTAVAYKANSGNNKLVVASGGSLTVTTDFEGESVTVETGGTLIINGTFTAKRLHLKQGAIVKAYNFDITNALPSIIATKVTVTNLTSIHNNGITFEGCAVLDTKDFAYYSQPNALLGVGLIKISGSVLGNSNQFTSSSSIYHYGTNAGNWGASPLSVSGIAACEVTTPVRFTQFKVVRVK